MRILHAVAGIALECGGTATAVLSLTSAQRRAGLDPRVITTFERTHPADPPASLREAGVSVVMVGPVANKLGWHRTMAGAMARAVADADVVHVHGVWSDIQYRAATCAQAVGVPYVWAPHGMLDPWSLRQSALRKRVFLALRVRRAMNGAARIHYQSDVERDLAGAVGLAPSPIVESPGLDLSEFRPMPPRGQFRDRYPSIGDRPLVLFLGRLHYKKGPDLLIRAFARARLGDAVLAMVGPVDDAYRATLDGVVKECSLDDHVQFTGMLAGQDRVAALQDADLFVLPSQQENFGIAVVEALAAGTPVVVSDQVNIYRGIVAAGVGGATTLEVDRVAAEIRRWMTDDDLRRGASVKARAFVESTYDIERVAEHWRGHYGSILSNG